MEVIICVVVSTIITVFVFKILAIHYFEIIDGYVKDVCEMNKKFTKSFMEHKQTENDFPKE